MKMKMVYTASEAAEACGVSYQTIYRRMNSGQLKSYWLPGEKQRRIKRQDLMKFLKHVVDASRPRPSGKPRVLAIQPDEAILSAAFQAFQGTRWFQFLAVRESFSFQVGAHACRWRPDLVLLDSRRSGALGSEAAQAILGDPGLAECRVIHLIGPDDPGLPGDRWPREATLKPPYTPDRLLETACELLVWEAPIADRDYVRRRAPFWKAQPASRRPPGPTSARGRSTAGNTG